VASLKVTACGICILSIVTYGISSLTHSKTKNHIVQTKNHIVSHLKTLVTYGILHYPKTSDNFDVDDYIEFYNHRRFHETLAYKKPMDVYQESIKLNQEKSQKGRNFLYMLFIPTAYMYIVQSAGHELMGQI
jgi:hypothetical protein